MKTIHRALALGAALCLAATGAAAQSSKGSPEHIKAATAKVDGAFIRANAAKTTSDWPSYGLDYAERYRNLRCVGTLAPSVYS